MKLITDNGNEYELVETPYDRYMWYDRNLSDIPAIAGGETGVTIEGISKSRGIYYEYQSLKFNGKFYGLKPIEK